MAKVAVVGAGIIGLSSAICIQRSCPDSQITLITEKLSPLTTSDIAAGVWLPYLLGETPEEEVYRWGKATYDFLHEQWKTDEGGSIGISMLPVVGLASTSETASPFWKNIVFGFRKMDLDEMKVFKKQSFRTGYSFVGFTCEGTKLLPHFLHVFESHGGRVEIKRVDDIKGLSSEFDIVVNCTGLQARHVVPDPSVQPIRGQILRVIAPAVKSVILVDDDDGNYVIPNQDTVVLGGTHQEDWNVEAYPEDREFIKTGCFHFVPSLKHAPVYKESVGLRPSRPRIRLEREQISAANGGIPFTIIHNYGHGGSGMTLFWGCALQAAELVKETIQAAPTEIADEEQFYYAPKSKL